MRTRRVAPVALPFVLGLAVARAQDAAPAPPPRPADATPIADVAQVLSGESVARIASLAQTALVERGIHVGVATVPSSHGTTPKDLAVRTLESWSLGPRSLLLLVSLEPREIWLQPGTELAPLLDEAAASAICHDEVAPRARAGDFGGGIEAGLRAAIEKAAPPPAPDPGLGWILVAGCCWLPVPLGIAGAVWFVWRRRHALGRVLGGTDVTWGDGSGGSGGGGSSGPSSTDGSGGGGSSF